jgi:hypothetical protein
MKLVNSAVSSEDYIASMIEWLMNVVHLVVWEVAVEI